MCGIFAYYGKKETAPKIIIKGLKELEYRGYDSWGVAIKTENNIEITKEIGKIGDIDNEVFGDLQSHIAMGHSRWATHGKVTKINAHPHATENGNIAIVHNGIFENYYELKKELQERGHEFKSETDTEVFAHLIEEFIADNTFAESIRLASQKVKGRFAIVALKKDEDKIIAIRKGSPLIIGVNKEENEYFIASDIPAFLEYTNKVIYLDDNQMAILDKDGMTFFDSIKNKEIKKRIVEITWSKEDAEKGEYEHFMLKEIMEQKQTLNQAINQDENLIKKLAQEIRSAYGTYMVGCGTAGKVCMTGEYIFSEIAKKHINVSFGSEFPYHKHFLTNKTLMICVSQSGETADTLEAIQVAKEKGVKITSIVNVESSTMARESDFVLPIKAGPEKAVASTKATTAQLAILTLLAYAVADKLKEGKQLLVKTAGQINEMLNPRYEKHIMELAKKIKDVESMYIIGRGINYPIALEAAIKLQELSYIHAEGFAAGELKHGPLALITEGTPVIAFVPNDNTKEETISNAIEVKARGGYIIGISPENNDAFDFWIKVPDAEAASPIVNIIPVQILSYQLALLRNYDPDKPRNLAKSVTVK